MHLHQQFGFITRVKASKCNQPSLCGWNALVHRKSIREWTGRSFPGGSGVKNPPAIAGDTGLIPDPGDSMCCRAIKPTVSFLVAQSCLTLCDPMHCSPPGSSVHGIPQARILEWVAISFSRGSPQPRDQTHQSCIAGRFFTTEPPGKTK